MGSNMAEVDLDSVLDIPELNELFEITEDAREYQGLFESNPSDVVEMEDNTLRQFFQVLNEAGINGFGIPSDIFEKGTVPLPDLLMSYPEMCTVRVCCCEKRSYFVYEQDGFTVALEIVDRNLEGIGKTLSVERGYSPNAEAARKVFEPDKMLAAFFLMADQMLKLWYSIQILLLNPVTKENIMRKTGKKKSSGICLSSKKNGRKACYVKRHKIEGDIFRTGDDDSKTTRKTLCWYVVGHWRNYSNGKKSFVNGYWKGPMRQVKRNLDDGRTRTISS